MTDTSKERILRLTANALGIRSKAGRSLYEPLGIFDFVEDHGIEVQFQNIASMEGMYCPDPGPIILINADRPPGRQAFTCAHEFGHHILGHGVTVDKLVNDEGSYWSNWREYDASCFGASILMPKLAVERAFAVRRWSPKSPSPLHIYTIASYLGVSYGGLITHMHKMLGLLSSSDAKNLSGLRPLHIKEQLIGKRVTGNLIIADEHWDRRPVDMQIGDFVLVPNGTHPEAKCLESGQILNNGQLYMAKTPGIGRLVNEQLNWVTFIRVSRRAYAGRNKFRFLEEVDYD